MKVTSKKYTEEITVWCDESEREETESWLANDYCYTHISEGQIASNQSIITGTKSTTITFGENISSGCSEIDAAREFIKNNHIRYRVYDDECYPPEVIQTSISDYPIAVSFKTSSTGDKVLVYILNTDYEFSAVGYSKKSI